MLTYTNVHVVGSRCTWCVCAREYTSPSMMRRSKGTEDEEPRDGDGKDDDDNNDDDEDKDFYHLWGGGSSNSQRKEALESCRVLCDPRKSPGYHAPFYLRNPQEDGKLGQDLSSAKRRVWDSRWSALEGYHSPYGRTRSRGTCEDRHRTYGTALVSRCNIFSLLL